MGCASFLHACMHYMPDKEPVFATAKVAEVVVTSAKRRGANEVG